MVLKRFNWSKWAITLLTATLALTFLPGTQTTYAVVENAYCDSDNLIVTVTIVTFPLVYRVNGAGPNLPTSAQGGPSDLEFVIAGPGSWSGLYFEYDAGGGTWIPSAIFTVTPSEITCEAPVAQEPIVIPQPGPDLIELPEHAVVGMFVANTTALWAPQPLAVTNVIFNEGKTVWVLGLDSTGQYYKIVLTGKYLWVPINVLGSNFDEIWNGTPLPTEVVE